MSLFADTTVIRDAAPLTDDNWHPEEIVGRDDQLTEIARALRTAARPDPAPPHPILVRGRNGVGKSAATQHVVTELSAESPHPVTSVTVNCNDNDTSCQAAAAAINKLRDERDALTPSNRVTSLRAGQSHLFRELYDEINTRSGVVIIIFDEIDALAGDDAILYSLSRATEHAPIDDDVVVGIIGLSNDLDTADALDTAITDQHVKRVHFPPYDADELRRILDVHADAAFRDDVDARAAIRGAAATAADSGSARKALRLLHAAAQNAEDAGRVEITADDLVGEAHVEREHCREHVAELDTQHAAVFAAVLEAAAADATPAPTRRIYNAYEDIISAVRAPKSQRRVGDYLRDLEEAGLVAAHEEAASGRGTRKVVQVAPPVAAAMDAAAESPHPGVLASSWVEDVAERAAGNGVVDAADVDVLAGDENDVEDDGRDEAAV